MIVARTLLTIILAVSLVALPARMGAIGISVGTDMAAAGMSDCPLMNISASARDEMTLAGGDTASMSDYSDQLGHHKNTQPGACFTYCNSVPLPPTIVAEVVELVLAETIGLTVTATLDGIGLSPEPHPPKRA